MHENIFSTTSPVYEEARCAGVTRTHPDGNPDSVTRRAVRQGEGRRQLKLQVFWQCGYV